MRSISMYGKKLQEIRKKLNLSQEEFATQTNITYRAYTSYERGDRKPSFEFLENLVLKYNVNLNWLIAGQGNMLLSDNDKISSNELIQQLQDRVKELEIGNKVLKELVKK